MTVDGKTDNSSLSVVVLAAGKGKRMKSATPKVLHELCGRPLISYVLDAVASLGAGEVAVVVGNGAGEVMEVAGKGCRFVRQDEQKGTGHAAMLACEEMDPRFDEVLVLPGDSPMVLGETLERLVSERRAASSAATLMTAEFSDPSGYGRVARDESCRVLRIVEDADATEEERAMKEVNACTYAFERKALVGGLATLTTDNAQGEYYLTGVVEHLASRDAGVIAVCVPCDQVLGVNDRTQLAGASALMRARINRRLMAAGVTLADPSTAFIDFGVEIGEDTVIMPQVFITGGASIGKDCVIGPCTSINSSAVGDGCEIGFSVVDGCEIAPRVSVGPFARLRPGCLLEEGSRAGTFVEMKKTKVGRGSKVPHLSYMGDATIGEDSNVGAGSITCNYDGEEKHPTTIGDRAFVGSDTMLVAPVSIGDDATTGAGSVIYEDVPDGSLGVERSTQKIIKDFKKKKKGKPREER